MSQIKNKQNNQNNPNLGLIDTTINEIDELIKKYESMSDSDKISNYNSIFNKINNCETLLNTYENTINNVVNDEEYELINEMDTENTDNTKSTNSPNIEELNNEIIDITSKLEKSNLPLEELINYYILLNSNVNILNSELKKQKMTITKN